MIAGLVGGALWAAWRRGIGGEIRKLRGLLETELANDEEHRERARRIIEQHQHMGYAGPLLNRDAFDAMCAAAQSTVVLEKGRPADGERRRAAMSRRDGWLRGASCAAVVLTDGADPDAERLVRKFEEVLGDEVWFLELA